jgi:hypothetical protein
MCQVMYPSKSTHQGNIPHRRTFIFACTHDTTRFCPFGSGAHCNNYYYETRSSSEASRPQHSGLPHATHRNASIRVLRGWMTRPVPHQCDVSRKPCLLKREAGGATLCPCPSNIKQTHLFRHKKCVRMVLWRRDVPRHSAAHQSKRNATRPATISVQPAVHRTHPPSRDVASLPVFLAEDVHVNANGH